MGEAKNSSRVDAVADSADSKGRSQAKTVGDGSGKETNGGEGAVKSDIGVVADPSVLLSKTSATEAAQGIEHTGAEEADEGDHEQLHNGRSKPHLSSKDPEALVYPTLRSSDDRGGLEVGIAMVAYTADH